MFSEKTTDVVAVRYALISAKYILPRTLQLAPHILLCFFILKYFG